MTYAFRPMQRRQAAQSFSIGAEEERRPLIEAATIGWCHAYSRREQLQCDRVIGRSDTAHAGARALDGTGGRRAQRVPS